MTNERKEQLEKKLHTIRHWWYIALGENEYELADECQTKMQAIQDELESE